MTDTSYFWQGGRRIEVHKDPADVTIHAASEADANEAAMRAGVSLRGIRAASPQLMRGSVDGRDIDDAIGRLRADGHIAHHVYRGIRRTGAAAAPASGPAAAAGAGPVGDDDNGNNDNEYLVTDSFFIRFKNSASSDAMRDFVTAHKLNVERDLGDRTLLLRVTDATGASAVRTANAAAERGDVEYAEPNLVQTLTRFFIPADERFSRQWHLHAPHADVDLVAGAGIFAPQAWDVTRGRRDVVVAVADDGFDLSHPDFQGEGKVVARLNAKPRSTSSGVIDWDDDVRPRPLDYHGTPCLGVAVAESDGRGVVGVAPGCALAAVRFPLSLSDDALVTMFRRISAVADVVSCSWGYPPANRPMNQALAEEIARLARSGGRRGSGLVFCVAAGNNNAPVRDLDNTTTYTYFDAQGHQVPHHGPIDRWIAAHPDVLTVSASTSRKTRSAYSSWGEQISVCAPSSNWDDLDRDRVLSGLGVTTTDNEGFGPRSDFTPGSRFTDGFGGTSSATPTVAGVCALVISANPALSADEVRRIVESTADKDLTIDSDTPVNRPGDFDASGFSLWFGHGKVNAARAVAAARAAAAAQRSVDAAIMPDLAIPDAGVAVFSDIAIDDPGHIVDLRIQIDVAHTYVGDLRVDLIAPDGRAVTLHDHAGGNADDLVRIWGMAERPALRGLIGRPIAGTWRLRVVDDFRVDTGRLRRWRIVAKVGD